MKAKIRVAEPEDKLLQRAILIEMIMMKILQPKLKSALLYHFPPPVTLTNKAATKIGAFCESLCMTQFLQSTDYIFSVKDTKALHCPFSLQLSSCSSSPCARFAVWGSCWCMGSPLAEAAWLERVKLKKEIQEILERKKAEVSPGWAGCQHGWDGALRPHPWLEHRAPGSKKAHPLPKQKTAAGSPLLSINLCPSWEITPR